MTSTIREIVDFWFGDINDDGTCQPENIQRWWRKSDEFDNELRERFGELVVKAGAGELDAWLDTADGCLALILLTDQMSRNIYRGTGDMFANDEKARSVARKLLDEGGYAELAEMQQQFVLMPLMHAEDIDLQNECVARFGDGAKASEGRATQSSWENAEKFARKHAVIIERFGRYPHRNELLGRESTAEEIEFLKGPDSSF